MGRTRRHIRYWFLLLAGWCAAASAAFAQDDSEGDKQRFVQYHGGLLLTGQRSTQPAGDLQVTPPEYYRAQFHSSLSLGVVPVSFNGFYTTENSPLRQNMNYFNVSIDHDQLTRNLRERLDARREELERSVVGRMDSVLAVEDLANANNWEALLESKRETLKDEAKNRLNAKRDSVLDLEQRQRRLDAKIAELEEKGGAPLEKLKAKRDSLETEKSGRLAELRSGLSGKSEAMQARARVEAERRASSAEGRARSKADRAQAAGRNKADRAQAAGKDKAGKKKDVKGLDVKGPDFGKKERKLARAKEEKDRRQEQFDALKDLEQKRPGEESAGDLKRLDTLGLVGTFERIMASVESFNIGTSFPKYSEFSINGAPLTGLNFEVSPWGWHAAFAGSKNLNPVVPSNDNAAPGQPVTGLRAAWARDLVAGSVGRGRQDEPHVHLNFVHGVDRFEQIDDLGTPVAVQMPHPKENMVVGTDFAFKAPFPELVDMEIEGEVSSSLLANDIRLDRIGRSEVGRWTTRPVFYRPDAEADVAAYAEADWEVDSLTRLKGTFRRVGGGYRSLGVPFLRRNYQQRRVEAGRYFWDSQLHGTIFLGDDRTNIDRRQPVSVETVSFGARALLARPKWPQLMADWSRHIQTQDPPGSDSATVNSRLDVWNLTANHGYEALGMRQQTVLSGTLQRRKAEAALFEMTLWNLQATHTMELPTKLPLQAGLSAGWTREISAIRNTSLVNGAATLAARFFRVWGHKVGYGADYNFEIGLKQIAFWETDLPLGKHLSLTSRTEWNGYQIRQTTFHAWTGQAGTSLNW